MDFPILCDTGASRSALSRELCESLHIKIAPLNKSQARKIFGIGGHAVNSVGTADVTIDITGTPVRHTFTVLQGIMYDALIGWDFLKRMKR